MKLLTEEVKRRLPPLGATEDVPLPDKEVAVKFFNPCGSATWYIFEGEPVMSEDGKVEDWVFFGCADLFNDGGELGDISLSELESVRLPFGLTIERDINFTGKRFRDTPSFERKERCW